VTAAAPNDAAARRRLAGKRHSPHLVQCMVYVSFAMPIGMLGAGWPAAHHTFGRSTGALGILALVAGIGRLVTSPIAEPLLRRWHIRHVTTVMLVGLGLACASIAVTHSFVVLAVAIGFSGFATGGLDSLGAHFQTVVRDVGRAGLMFGAYGIGATLGPVLVALTSWSLAFGAAAGVALATAWLAWSPPVRWPGHFDELASASEGGRPRVGVRAGAVALLLAVFGIFCGIEMISAAWGASYLRDHHHATARAAGLAMSGFWGGLTIGRLSLGGLRVRPDQLLRGAAVGVVVAYVGMATLPTPGAIACLTLGGLSLAAMFPALMSTTADRVGAAAAGRVAGWQLLAANVAETAFAAGTGLLVTHFGSRSPAVLMAGLAVVGLPVLLWSLSLHGERADPEGATGTLT
jgi:predicted MFS family arabinose efflux permease